MAKNANIGVINPVVALVCRNQWCCTLGHVAADVGGAANAGVSVRCGAWSVRIRGLRQHGTGGHRCQELAATAGIAKQKNFHDGAFYDACKGLNIYRVQPRLQSEHSGVCIAFIAPKIILLFYR
jgi:hypothetical protein